MSFTPAMITTASGLSATTSRSKRARIWSARSPFTPRFNTSHSGCARAIHQAYWLVTSPLPDGGASIGDRNPGVPAVVESPIATMRRTAQGILGEPARIPESPDLHIPTTLAVVAAAVVLVVPAGAQRLKVTTQTV